MPRWKGFHVADSLTAYRMAPDLDGRIYFFGHVFINATIYMSVMAVYELLPLYAKRPWKISRPFLAAWACVWARPG